ncbi:CHASE2 and HATPase_c domain-containing protein [Burkholderia metallica]|uniref:sensor histidine kinase n=1 Tax=Burkholderia metallica TaxID=488729 RepID=UPI001FC7F5E3|nr:CHASE2 and HATPase_c domain-containing protein [Burkholderia metallica]
MPRLSVFVRYFFKNFARLGPLRGSAVIAMLALAAVSGHPGVSVVSGAFDRILFDAMQELYERGHSSNVVVVNIDEPTLDALGLHDRLDHPQRLLARLKDARAVVLDLPFVPCSTELDLIQGMRENGKVVLTFPDCSKRNRNIDMLLPGPTLRDVAAGIGQRDITMGHFGVVEGFVPYARIGGRIYPHAALEALRVAGVVPPVDPQRYMRAHAVAVGQVRTDAVLAMLHGPEDLTQYSYLDVLDGRIPESDFAGKIVFIGHSAWLGEGRYEVSSLNTENVSHAQLDALITEAVENGHIVRKLPSSVTIPLFLLLTFCLVLICMFVPGRAMHIAAFGWGMLLFLVPLGLLAFHIWLPIGLLPFVWPLLYGFFAWERHGRMVALLRREVAELGAIAASIGTVRTHSTQAFGKGAGELRDVKAAMREVRAWQQLYVDVINQLPYPVFLAIGGKVVVWNAKAAEVMSVDVAANAAAEAPVTKIEALVAESIRSGSNVDREMSWNGRDHLLTCELLSETSRESSTSTAASQEAAPSHLVCLIDVADLKSGVSHAQLVLRHIAHDMRSPLSSILALIERRAMQTLESGASGDEHFLRDLRVQADYSLRVANGFMQLSRAEQLARENFVPILLDDIAEQAIDHISVRAQQKSIEMIGPNAGSEDVWVLGDPDMLERAIVNVLDNSVKYSAAGTKIEVWVTADGANDFTLHVRDQGIGMSQDSVRRLFEPFFQAEHRRDVDGGVGLGMPFVKAVIDRHGGTIDVVSRIGVGTELMIRMPRMSDT